MNIAFINEGLTGSTGNVLLGLAAESKKQGFGVCIVGGTGPKPSDFDTFLTNDTVFKKIVSRFSDLDGSDGFCNPIMTKAAIRFIDSHHPDIINLHNSHDHYLDTAQIIRYANKKNIPIIWTLHDCWVVSGHCCSFAEWNCERWKAGCGECPYRGKDPYRRSILGDFSHHFWVKKHNLIDGNPNIRFVSPSHFVAGIIKTAGFRNDVIVVPNGIDLSSFAPTKPIDSIMRKANGRNVVIACNGVWNESKGLGLLSELADKLDPTKFFIAAAGLRENNKTSEKIYRISHISSKAELASFYSSGDVFINLTLQDNFPTVNIESIACGTPIASFITGGAAEMIEEGINGISVKQGDLNAMVNAIEFLVKQRLDRMEVAASAFKFGKEECFRQYNELFQKVLAKKAAQ